jgi:hypothetical protein
MSTELWRWADPHGQQRRVRLDELRAALAEGAIAPNTPVWRPGWKNWQPAHEVPELTTSALSAANGVVPNIPPPPLAVVAVQHEYEAKSLAPRDPSATDEEPPPPPNFVPVPPKSGGSLAPPAPAHPPHSSGMVPTHGSGEGKPYMGSSLPTTIGVPPPPELQAMVAKAQGGPRLAPAPHPGSGPTGNQIVEELSGSMLLDESGPVADPFAAPNGQQPRAGGVPLAGESGAHRAEPPRDSLGDIAGLPPRRPGLSLILDDLKEIKSGRPPRNKLLIGVLGFVALMVLIMIVAGIVSLFSGPSDKTAKDKDKKPTGSGSVATTAAPPATSAKIDIPPPPPKDEVKSLGDCSGAGEAKPVAPKVVVGSGIEAVAVNGGIAIGFASTARDVVAATLDPTSLGATSTVRSKSLFGDARRVTPAVLGGKLTALADADRKGDKLVGRRTVATAPLVDIGVADAAIVWAPHGRDSYAKLFPLDSGEGPVEALRAIPLSGQKGIALAFRRGTSIFIGTATGDAVLNPEGSLSSIAGLGQVGSPAIAASGDTVLVAWADRAQASDNWGVRWTKLKVGGTASEASSFAIPEGGLGGQAMSPSLAALGGGRFLFAWTEGPVQNHQVRAITLGSDGLASGSPIAISGNGVNAGQPAAAVGADGRGVVAFVAAKGKAYEVQATSVSCPKQ